MEKGWWDGYGSCVDVLGLRNDGEYGFRFIGS